MAHDTKRTKEQAHDMKERQKRRSPWLTRRRKSTHFCDTKEATKEGASKVAETAQAIADKAKQAMQDAVGAAEATQKIKETVVGSADDDKKSAEDYIEDHTGKVEKEDTGENMDEDVVEQRRRARGSGLFGKPH
ncbi:hypothetical protein HAX54_047431 [Datura stramonium]|uniref:Uncharacterized protein n=1 Tax=Datura stramonium TaxID=4076 RepID=A0ABS8SSU7_DATST|nr:hypothetical protein [Datura stramonium]